MKTFKVKYTCEFEEEIGAADLALAELLARCIVARFPGDTCKLLSIMPADDVEPSKETNLADALPKDAQAVLDRNEAFAKKVRLMTDPEVA